MDSMNVPSSPFQQNEIPNTPAMNPKIKDVEEGIQALETSIGGVSKGILVGKETIATLEQSLAGHKLTLEGHRGKLAGDLKTKEQALPLLSQKKVELTAQKQELEAKKKPLEDRIKQITEHQQTIKTSNVEAAITLASLESFHLKTNEIESQIGKVQNEYNNAIEERNILEQKIQELTRSLERIKSNESLLVNDKPLLQPNEEEQNLEAALNGAKKDVARSKEELGLLKGDNIPYSKTPILKYIFNFFIDRSKNKLKESNKEAITQLERKLLIEEKKKSEKLTLLNKLFFSQTVEATNLIEGLKSRQPENEQLLAAKQNQLGELQSKEENHMQELLAFTKNQDIQLFQKGLEKTLDDAEVSQKLELPEMIEKTKGLMVFSTQIQSLEQEIDKMEEASVKFAHEITLIQKDLSTVDQKAGQLLKAQTKIERLKTMEAETILKTKEERAEKRIQDFINNQFTPHIITPFVDQVKALKTKIEEAAKNLEASGPDDNVKAGKMVVLEDLKSKLAELDKFKEKVDEVVEKHLTGGEVMIGKKTVVLKGMKEEIEKAKDKGKDKGEEFAKTYQVLNKFSKHTFNDVKTAVAALTDHFAGELLKISPSLKKELAVKDITINLTPGYIMGKDNIKNVLEFFKKQAADDLSKADNLNWKEIAAEMTFANGVKGTSLLTPAKEMKQTRVPGLTEKPMLASGERARAKGVVNQWSSSYSVKDANGKMKILLQINRSAVLAMDKKHLKTTLKGAAKEEEFQEINRAKVHQSLSVELDQQLHDARFISPEKETINRYIALLSDTSKEAELDKEKVAGNIVIDEKGDVSFPKITLAMNHTTVGLLTLLLEEGEMWNIQKAAEDSFNDKPTDFELKVGENTVKINCQWSMAAYDFGVAEIPLPGSGLLGIMRDALSGHDKVNKAAFLKTKERHTSYIAKTTAKIHELTGKVNQTDEEIELRNTLKEELENANMLMRQIKENGGVEGFKNLGNAYAIPARILLLEDIMGGGKRIHCKSGKDRTSLLDIEVKYLAQQLENQSRQPLGMRRMIPVNQRDETEEDRLLRNQIALESGNLLITLANTGETGVKTVDRNEGMKKFGPDIATFLGGDSGLVKS